MYRKLLAFLLPLAFSLGVSSQTRAPSAPGSAGRIDDPMSITSIRLVVGHPTYGSSRQRVILGRAPAAITATFVAAGGGVVSGHWEFAMPADGMPTALDLTPTPLLSSAARMQQRRFRQKEMFTFSLSPGERYVLTGPIIKSSDMPATGRYHVLLKIDSASSMNVAVATMPSRISPIILEVEMPKAAVMAAPASPVVTSESTQ
jgi:hypothetical protein